MSTKLTLRVDEHLVAFGKRWARRRGQSLSRVVSDYLTLLEKLPGDESELPPITRQLLGVAREASVTDYRRHLEKKYS
jgi:replicative DNA helicase